MTSKQLLNFYLPAWNRAWEHLWVKDGKNIASKPGRRESDHLDQVETCAAQMARKESRPMRREDLRHAVNLVATGRKSSKQMTNTQINQAVALLDLLIDPESLAAAQKLTNPEVAQRAAYLDQIGRTPYAYALAICRSKYKTNDWNNLSFIELREFAMTLRHRQPGGASLAPRSLPASRSIGRTTEHQPI